MVGIGYSYGKAAPPAPPAAVVVTAADPADGPERGHAPAPDADGVAIGATGGMPPVAGLAASPGIPALGRSLPLHVSVPRVGIASDLMTLGLEPDNTVQVPPEVHGSPAGWYEFGASPGEPGPAVILGHVDSDRGPGVFYNLGSMRAGDEIVVRRADGATATFRADRVATYPKESFPTRAVYGNVGQASLRLVTCGGTYDRGGIGYSDNVIVFASLASTGAAPQI